ncbi:hypothetical protein NRIC_17910 [Enterococcus florum]|uniref:MFS transporter n=1 Tax=Enterococcus florum TaxID=2480627 RepID=A0A4P5P7U3_9ENTE|nr:hypothetical protein [Enterococcus florum]GCF93900.1 hypothetical protein NRIC_17910 [Enterococcus florum]
MEHLKKYGRMVTATTPFVLSNTLILIPYILYIHLINERHTVTILPFVLFYTFRMTSIFLIRGLNRSIEKYTLQMLGLLLGGIGTVFSFLGPLYFPFFLIGSVCLGLGAAWFPPANTSVNFYERSQGYRTIHSHQYLFALLLLIPLFVGISGTAEIRLWSVLGVYSIYFVLAYGTVRRYPHYELDFKDMQKTIFVDRELLWFLLFSAALILLRSARLLWNETYLNGAIVLFCGIFLVGLLLFQRKKLKLPLWVNTLTFFNGMCGNFIFLFGAFYVGGVYGKANMATHLFLPYVIGMVAALLAARKLQEIGRDVFTVQWLGLLLSLLLLLMTPWFSLGIACLTFFQKGTSSWLNRWFYQADALPESQRITAKYAVSNKGSIVHQFLLMGLIALILSCKQLPVRELFLLPTLPHGTTSLAAAMVLAKNWSCIGMLLGLIMIRRVKKNNAHRD